MTKLTNVRAAPRRVSGPAVKTSNRCGKIDPAWAELADHVLIETLPSVAVVLEFGRSLREGRLPLRAILLLAMLAI